MTCEAEQALPFHGVSVHATITIDPADVPAFYKLLKPVYDDVIAEPECTLFEVYENPNNPGEISYVQNWAQTEQWLFDHQFTKKYYEDYLVGTMKMYKKPEQVRILSRIGPPYTMVKKENGGLWLE